MREPQQHIFAEPRDHREDHVVLGQVLIAQVHLPPGVLSLQEAYKELSAESRRDDRVSAIERVREEPRFQELSRM